MDCEEASCSAKASLKRPKNGKAICRQCFYDCFEREIHETIVNNKLFTRGQKIALGASGGKDSTVLAHVLKVNCLSKPTVVV